MAGSSPGGALSRDLKAVVRFQADLPRLAWPAAAAGARAGKSLIPRAQKTLPKKLTLLFSPDRATPHDTKISVS